MSARLDWEIESEQSSVKQGKEDPLARQLRRRAQFRLFIGVLLVLGCFVGIYQLVMWRLEQVNTEIELALTDTVTAEVATLRSADRSAFLNVQRSASEEWAQVQAITFNSYQELKQNRDVQLTGSVIAVEIDDTRGRVQVEEIIDGVPYVQTWFYWHYLEDGDDLDTIPDGWRHVPPDYTFWGQLDTLNGQGFSIRYQSVDAAVAQSLADELTHWLQVGCQTLICGTLPDIAIEIIPRAGLVTDWSGVNPWLLQVPSPYVARARADRPLDLPLKTQIAERIAQRLLSQASTNVQPPAISDAYYLRTAVQRWLIGEFIQLDTQSYLMGSYFTRYGRDPLNNALALAAGGGDIRVLSAAAGLGGIDQLEVDWRDYLQWRLDLEAELLLRRDQTNFLALYDLNLPNVASLAYTRLEAGQAVTVESVLSVQSEPQPDAVSALRAVILAEGAQQEVIFRLVDGTWRRAN
ncbi:MAG: hypothetical protein ACOYL5_04860 [Phototrophicaceae bacterium]